MMHITMTITSFWYLILLFTGLILYYIMRKRGQWIVLLLMSLVFYYFAAVPYTFVFLIFSTAVAYISTAIVDRFKAKGKLPEAKFALMTAIALNILAWLLISGSKLWTSGLETIQKTVGITMLLRPLPVVAAMGMAYYTSQVIAYIVDCYWESIERQKNPIKLLTFVCFFPQLTSGPISRYKSLKSIFEVHSFHYKNLCFGAQRILWGFFKKLVLADRMGIIVNAVWGNYTTTYRGLWMWIAMLLYPVLLYADFSGCMDIALGTAELFDIHLDENFNNPLLSKSIREFWGRWHITLGSWAKDYVMYPILKSPRMVSFTKKAKKKFGKRLGKFIPAALASGAVWLVMGLWHGDIKYIIGVSLYYWLLIEMGELFDPYCKKIIGKLAIDTEKFSWKLFQCIRTYFIYAFGLIVFKADSVKNAYGFIRRMLIDELQPWILFDGSVLGTGITWGGVNLIIAGMCMLLAVALLREKYGYARVWIARQGVIFRWFIWISLFVLVLIYGAYGPGYSAAEFIYEGF